MREHPKPKKRPSLPGKILVTAGPTIEPLDPVRYISNRSTGTMGYTIAAEAERQGFKVCLVTGPVCLNAPAGVEVVNVTTAREMRKQVLERVGGCDALVMAAAVCDLRPLQYSKSKIKKRDAMTMRFVRNPDILAEAGKRKGFIKIGFALETDDPVSSGRQKLKAKKLDRIIINTIRKGSDPFGRGGGRYTMIDAAGNRKEFKKSTKKRMAKVIINEVRRMLG